MQRTDIHKDRLLMNGFLPFEGTLRRSHSYADPFVSLCYIRQGGASPWTLDEDWKLRNGVEVRLVSGSF